MDAARSVLRPLQGPPYPGRVPVLLAPRYWGAHLLMVLALAAAVALGIWQYHAWEAGRAAEQRDLSEAAPLALDAVMKGDDPFPGKYLGQPVSFSGEWLPRAPSTSPTAGSTAGAATG